MVGARYAVVAATGPVPAGMVPYWESVTVPPMPNGAKTVVDACFHRSCVVGGAIEEEAEPREAVYLARTQSTQGASKPRTFPCSSTREPGSYGTPPSGSGGCRCVGGFRR